VREAMNGQTDCSTINSLDLTTSFVRDSWLRLTKTTLPLGDCQHYEYDTSGRPVKTKLRDDCVSTNTGNTIISSYDTNGLLSELDYVDPNSVTTRQQQSTHYDSLQMASRINPVSTSYSATMSFTSDGQFDTYTAENSLSMSKWIWDPQNRETTRQRFIDSMNHNDWAFSYGEGGGAPTSLVSNVTDPASKVSTTDYDDLGRLTRRFNPDSGTTFYVYDAASRLITVVEGYGSTDQVTHSFSYDNIGRKLTEDYNSESCSGTNPVEVQYTYDALPTGVTCPTGATCTRLNGRLAYIKEVLMCTSTSPFHLDQETFYGYDDAGRLISEEVDDPSPRTAQTGYTWDKNSNLTQVTAPSGAAMAYTLGSTGNNSDTNLITSVARVIGGTTNLLTGILWEPFGPPAQYDQANTIGGANIRATLSWNLAYRTSKIDYSTIGGGTLATHIDYTEDEKGRYTQKLYSHVNSGVLNDHLQYDFFDRPTCDATVSGTCPTSGSTLKTNVNDPVKGGYNSSNDRQYFIHQDASFGGYNYTVSYNTGTDKVSSILKSDSTTHNYSWDGRGNRTADSDSSSTNTARNYTYDGRRRVRTVTGFFPRHVGGLDQPTGYTVTYAFDHRDRLVFRQWQSSLGGSPTQQFYYYDLNDRLIEVKQAIAGSSSYTNYSFYWLGNRPVAYWAVDNLGNTSRYFIHADEANRVLEVYSWPASGDATDIWSLNPDVFGWDRIVNGGIFQPLHLNNALYDPDTVSYTNWGAVFVSPNHPPLLVDRGAHLDPMTETFLQRVGAWPNEPYAPVTHAPATALHMKSAERMIPRLSRRSCVGSSGTQPPTNTIVDAARLTCANCSDATGTLAPSMIPSPKWDGGYCHECQYTSEGHYVCHSIWAVYGSLYCTLDPNWGCRDDWEFGYCGGGGDSIEESQTLANPQPPSHPHIVYHWYLHEPDESASQVK
jgi:YD repeat-containing protein